MHFRVQFTIELNTDLLPQGLISSSCERTGETLKLTSDQQQQIREKYGICVNEACDRCGQVFGLLAVHD